MLHSFELYYQKVLQNLYYHQNICANIIASSKSLNKLLLSVRDESFRIVYFHMITPYDKPYYFKTSITPDIFKKIIIYLNKKYKIIPLPEAVEMIKNGKSLKNYLSITIDDGFVENYDYVAPILFDLKLSATFFLIDDCINNENLMWRNKIIYIQNKIGFRRSKQLMDNLCKEKNINQPLDNEDILSWSIRTWDMSEKDILVDNLWKKAKLEPLKEFLEYYKPYLTVNQIKKLLSNGFSVGSHSKTHPLFSELTFEQMENEIIGSINSISKKTGKRVNLFAYPFRKRALPEYEEKLIFKHPDKIKAILGIKNSLNNFNNPYKWERDYLEMPYNNALFNFLLIPVIRKYIFMPFNIKI